MIGSQFFTFRFVPEFVAVEQVGGRRDGRRDGSHGWSSRLRCWVKQLVKQWVKLLGEAFGNVDRNSKENPPTAYKTNQGKQLHEIA
jgi:hypothetical protein